MRRALLVASLMLLIPANAAAAPIIDVVKAVAPQGKTPAGVAITASDPSGAPVNSVRVDRADGGGSFAESSCRVTRSGKYTPVGGAFEVPIPGGTGGDVVVSVGTGTCVPVVPGQPAPQPQTTSQGYSLQLPRADEVAPPLVPLPQLPTLPLPVPDPKLPIARASAGCANADLAIVGRTRKLVRKAIICLVNVERAKVGARKVRSNLKLQKAGAAHAADMRRRSYFAHEGPGGPDLVSRLRKARFWPATAGENLGAATGGLSTARAVVDAWMHSEGHRVNMLDKRFRYLGIGIEPMFPAPPEAPGATIAAEFGVR